MSDLAQCDFWLFPKLKRPLRGHRFDTVEEIQADSKKALKAIPEIEFNKCFDDWKKRWHKCIISGGDYFEGDEIYLENSGISCKDCEACYIGETKRSLKTRIKEHINNKNNESVVCQHQINFGHEIDWNRTVEVDSEISYKKRLISEMIHIKCQKNSIKKDDIYTLNSNYFPLLKILKI